MELQKIDIDIETFSDVDIKTSGVFKYVESDNFQILLFAYSINDNPVTIIDLASGEEFPNWIKNILVDPLYIKQAHNAMFEWVCLQKIFGKLPIEQWRCTMIHSLYCGYPASLEAVGKALGFKDDKKKQNAGKALIRYFCQPCTSTKSNGGRTRNLPHHDMDKWKLFKDYCIQDVVAEQEIDKKLRSFQIPTSVQKEWWTDVKINSRGVKVDMDFVQGAIDMGQKMTDDLITESREITGLNNPNSVSQLKEFVEQNSDINIDSLNKSTVSKLLDNEEALTEDVCRALEIRQELSKTSIKKYNAIESVVCKDGRVRGLLQFYGANRTGRWAGRLVQVQNLPRTYIDMLPFARQCVKNRNANALAITYGSVTDTLSQLIRTAFVPDKGKVFIDVDFSSIEARVISWLAGEAWRLNVFKTHGKIYEACASQMFGVPLERIKKGNPEYALRQKGKVAELALGYQGGSNAMIAMGAIDMGLHEEELPDIVGRWREANKRIQDLWYKLEKAAIYIIKNGGQIAVQGLVFSKEIDKEMSVEMMTITLPSKRKLFYISPKIGINRWDKESIIYQGMNQQTKKWETVETYGGKLTENCVQAIARDCLSYSIENLENAGYPVVFHVHDEVVIEFDKDKADIEKVASIMKQPISWARDLPLDADGWIGDFYRKD